MSELIGRGEREITGIVELAPDEVTDLDGGFVHVGWTDRFPMEIGEPVDPGLVFGTTSQEIGLPEDPYSDLHMQVQEAWERLERLRKEMK